MRDMVSSSAPVQEGSTEKKKRDLRIPAIVSFVVFLLILAFLPTPHARIKNESKSDLESFLDCSNTIKDNWLIHWDLTDLSDNLKIVVDVGSTEEVKIYVKSVEGTVSNEQGKIHDYTVYGIGPSLYVEIKNPGPIIGSGPSAVVSGEIRVYHDYEEQVSYIEWLPWWMS